MLNVDYNVMVAAIPKCGSYLTGSLLKSLGFKDQELHVYNKDAEDYYGIPESEKIEGPNKTFKFDLISHLRNSRPGTFVVGHPALTSDLAKYLMDETSTKVIYVTRDLRDAAISQMRFLERAGDIHDYVRLETFWDWDPDDRGGKLYSFLCSRSFHEWLKYATSMYRWENSVNYLDRVCVAKYEDIFHYKALNLLNYLGMECPEIYVGVESRTYNGDEPSRHTYWFWDESHDKVWKASGASNYNTNYE